MHYRVEVKIEEKEKAIEKMKEEAGCFVLVNNVPKEGEDGYITSEILKAYKDQHGIEQNFKFLLIITLFGELVLVPHMKLKCTSFVTNSRGI